MPKHIVRLIALIVVLGALAALAKWYFTADSFYEFGHYRAASVPEIAGQEPVYQTPRYCQACHSERHAQWSANSHKSVTCEVCHGAAQGHPQNAKLPISKPDQRRHAGGADQGQPQNGKLLIPKDSARLCSLCHESMPGRPRTQPQVVLAEHSGGQQCVVCHNAHAPKLAGVVAPVAGDAVAGGKKHAVACATCHGEKGISPNDSWPNLAGQNAAYLVRILAAYKSGDQKDVVMTPIAQPLSTEDIQNLAAYYGSLSCAAPPSQTRVGDPAAGKAVAANCTACHGATGVGSNPAWPTLAGQKPTYLVNVLKAFRAGLRKDPMMAGVTRGLSDTDIANLAAYYSAQSCQPATQVRKKS